MHFDHRREDLKIEKKPLFSSDKRSIVANSIINISIRTKKIEKTFEELESKRDEEILDPSS